MFPLFLFALDAATTKPSDLLAALHARTGHAFVPITQAPFVWATSRSRRDEVVFGNYATNRWSLKIPTRGGYARGLTVPIDSLFDLRSGTLTLSSRPPPPERNLLPSAWRSRSGVLASVTEILRAGLIPLERCHWAYRRRMLIVRFDPNDLEAGLPDLAGAVGGTWNARRRTIDFDPRAFRDQTRASISESVMASTDRHTLSLALERMGILHASDVELTTLFATDHGSARFEVDRLTADERAAVFRYLTISLKGIDRDLGPSNEYRKLFDSGRAPYIAVAVDGQGGVGYAVPSGRGGLNLFEL